MSTSTVITVDHGGTTYHGRFARVERTMLGYEDHGILTAYLHLAAPGWGQGAGGYFLDTYDEASDRRIGTAYGMDYIIAILHLLGSGTWEGVKDAQVIALYADAAACGAIVGLSNPATGDVLIFAEIAKPVIS